MLPENYRLCLCGMAAAQQLDCDQALRLYAGAKSLAERYVGPKSVAATMVTGLVALVRYERGDVCGAEISVLDTLDLIETTAFHEGFLQAFVVLVRAAVARGDNARALNLLNRAERLSWERGWGRVVATLLVERTRLLLAEGNLQEPVSLLQAFEQLKAQPQLSGSAPTQKLERTTQLPRGSLPALPVIPQMRSISCKPPTIPFFRLTIA